MNDAQISALANPPPAAETTGVSPPYGRDDGGFPHRVSARDFVVQFFYYARLIRNCILHGLAVGVAPAVLVPTLHRRYFDDCVCRLRSAAAQDASVTGPTVVSIDGLKVVESEIQIIQTDQVIASAVDRIGPEILYPALARPRWFGLMSRRDPAATRGAAIEDFRRDLRAEAEASSNVIRIGFTHPDRAIAIQAVQAVLDAYLSQRRTIYANTNSSFLDQEIARTAQRLRDFETQIQSLRRQYDVLDMAQDIVLATNRLDGIVQRQNQVRERRVAVETEIAAVKSNLAQQPETVFDFRETTNNTGNDEARNTLVRLEQEHTYLLSQFRTDWPALGEIDKKIANVRAQMGPKNQNLYFSERSIRNPAIALLSNRLASLEVEGKALGEQLVELADQSRQAGERIVSLREAEGKLHGVQLARDVTETIYRQLSLRKPATLFQDSIVDERNANLRVVQPPTAPFIGQSMVVPFIVGGTFLGVLLGIAATLLATLLRDVDIAPNEAERSLRIPNLAELGSAAPGGDAADDRVAIGNLAALLQEMVIDGRGLTSVQFAGISEGDRRSVVIRAVAVELASGYAQKTLLLDLQGGGDAHVAALGNAPEAAVPAGSLQAVRTEVPDLWVGIGVSRSAFTDPRVSIAHLRQALEVLQKQFSLLVVIAAADLVGAWDAGTCRVSGRQYHGAACPVRAARSPCGCAMLS